MRQYVLQGARLQGALSLSGLQRQSVHEEGGDDQALQMAQEEGRVPAAWLHEILADRRLLGEAPWPGLSAQQKANPLSLHSRELRQGVHIDIGRANARELPSQGLGHHTGGLPTISGHRELRDRPLSVRRSAYHALSLSATGMSVHVQE